MAADDHPGRIDQLTGRTVREAFEANPALARSGGDHRFDGVLPDVSAAAVSDRSRRLEALIADLGELDTTRLDPGRRADVGTARAAARDELFHLAELRDPATDPQWALWRGADVASYVSRDYAPRQQRAEALLRHLEQVPDWLDAADALLEGELAEGPRGIAADSARGHASFYRREVLDELGELADPGLRGRLAGALEAAAAACERQAARIIARPPRPLADTALGGRRFCAMLAAQEGVTETVAGLRSRVDAELDSLERRTKDLARRIGAASPAAAFAAMEADHPSAAELLPSATGMLERLRQRWADAGVVTIPEDITCRVRETPAFMTFISAAYEPPGALDSPDLPHFYFVTPVDAAWPAEKAEEWLQHLNFACLENISIHEVYPGHFVHCVAANRQPSPVRRSFWFGGFGEGWAHYTELLAVEQGFAEANPRLELAMLQDAILRCCRFNATLGIHAEGMTLDEATRAFVARSHIPQLAAEREALRATYDPMYLVYTYGKLEILRWRDELSRRPGFEMRGFHDGMLELGYAPLAVVRDHVLDGGAARG